MCGNQGTFCGIPLTRGLLWSAWGLNACCTIGYSISAILLMQSINVSLSVASGDTYSINLVRSMSTAMAIGLVCVLGYAITSALMMTIHSFGKAGPKFTYGFVLASSVHTAFIMLVVGVFLSSQITSITSSSGNSVDKLTFTAVTVFSFICLGSHLAYFILLSIVEYLGNPLILDGSLTPEAVAAGHPAPRQMAENKFAAAPAPAAGALRAAAGGGGVAAPAAGGGGTGASGEVNPFV